ncbi:MAG: hypothetical protein ABIU10_06625 [Sphingomicrobium sp.]
MIQEKQLKFSAKFLAPAALLVIAAPAPAAASLEHLVRPMEFFDGHTEMVSLIKVFMKKAYWSRTSGNGKILADGTLALVQQVQDSGAAPHMRKWQIRQVAAGRFTGTMSDAIGPVAVQEVNGKYRFSFTLKGNLAVEQWLTPLPGGKSANSKISIRKLGMRVASSEGTIHKL